MPGIECGEITPRVGEAGLFEDAVGGQEHLPVDMGRLVPIFPRLEAGDAVIDPAPPLLIEAQDDGGRHGPGHPQPLRHLFDGHGHIHNPTLEEVPREGGLWEYHHLGISRLG